MTIAIRKITIGPAVIQI